MIPISFDIAIELWKRYQEKDCGKAVDATELYEMWKHRKHEFMRAVGYSFAKGYAKLTLDPEDENRILKQRVKALENQLHQQSQAVNGG